MTLTFVESSYEKINKTVNTDELVDWSPWDVLEIIRKLVKLWEFDPNYLGLDPYKETLKFGYPAENHKVQTDDGYLLTVLRIPHGKNDNNTQTNRPIAYLHPGLLCSAACFTDYGPPDALAYFLVDAGYDVWIPHPRGTSFSRNHTTFNSMKDKKYWNFSWHEMGTIDVPNTIDYILQVTKSTQVNYIGHSQGTTVLFVMLSENPEYNTKIKVAVALAPIAFMENLSSSLLRKLSKMYPLIKVLLESLGFYGVFPHTKPFADPVMDKCNYNSTIEDLAYCSKWLDFAVGYHQNQIDPRNISLFASHYPGGASAKQLEHYTQLINNGGFTKFNSGKNIYEQNTSLSYNLQNINATLYLIYGENDILSTPKDVKKLHEFLPTSQLLPVNFSPFSHFDFLYAKVAPDILYVEIINILNKYNKNDFKMIIKTIFVLIFIVGTFSYDEGNSELDNLVEINDILNTYSSFNNLGSIMRLLHHVVNKWKFNPGELGLPQLDHIKSYGYPAEEHIIETDDGYLLTVMRIPHGINGEQKRTNRPVVYLQPGLYCSAGCYIDIGAKRALGFLLADLGFDVWIANPRGTTYSRNHTTHDSMNDKKYWQFSWHEVGSVDIPNTIDYILARTGQKQVNYIGHSQGTTTLFVMLSEKPEYNEKIKVAFALAPVAFMENVSPSNKSHSILRLVKFAKPLANLLNILKVYDLLPHNDHVVANFTERCNYNTTDSDIEYCEKLWSYVDGFNPEQNDARDIGVILTHFPGGCSVKQLLHFSQLIEKGGFKKYDFGMLKNRKIYGQNKPPAYNLSNINAPVYLMYGDKDTLSTPEDVKILHNLLPSSTLFRVDYAKFRHSDFLYAKDWN
ncbi:uncharacterized protein LOC123301120 [Chrysoperla carnea]|uniref:uncharacterized protein LOC123301120 n=1 Tax=Chrysoperla carnea TaxID=189513 RepID=UPI001D08E372|nr:uncharacterized protein LOC123301120 [Chrysoperla carnea]